MKNAVIIILGLCLITVSLSIAYYFVIFLPQQQRITTATLKKIEQSTKNAEENTQYAQPTTDTSNIQGQLDNINNSLQKQQEDMDAKNNCEAEGGKYLGSGSCCISNCSNVQ